MSRRSYRVRKWAKRTDPKLVSQAYEASREVQLDLGSVAQVEHEQAIQKVKSIMENKISNPIQKSMYISYAQSIPYILKKYPSKLASMEVASHIQKWVTRGLDPQLLVDIAKSYGLDPTPYLVSPGVGLEDIYKKLEELQEKDEIIESELIEIRSLCENLNSRIYLLELVTGVRPTVPFIIGVATAGFVKSAGESSTIQPYTGIEGASKGMPLPFPIKLKNLYVLILTNTLDEYATIQVLKNEEPTSLSVVINPGGTGIFSVSQDVIFNEGDTIQFKYDLTAASEGELDIVAIVCRADPLV